MKPCSAELLQLLALRQFYIADLYTFNLVGGTTLRYCGGDMDISANGVNFSAGGQTGPYWDRKDNKAKIHWKLGVETDVLTIDCIPGSSEVLGAPFLQAVREGVFDAAEFILDRAIMPTYGDTRRGLVRMFVGRVAEVDSGRSLATFSINSHLELLNLQLPRNLYQVGCVNNLGDASCTVNISSFMSTGVVTTGSTVGVVNSDITGSFSTGVFNLGKMTFTSGDLDGYSIAVRTCTFGATDVITVLGFLPSAPAPGDTFNIFMGCNKSLTDGNGCPKFSNTAHFRGFPFIPQPATAV